MPENRVAVIDIGTNSVLLLVCEVTPVDGALTVLLDTGEITRLGYGLNTTGRLEAAAIERAFAVLKTFTQRAESLGASRIAAIGTSALRIASNANDLINQVERELGIDVKVISGETEAYYTYLAVRSDTAFYNRLSGQQLVLIDIGGGSTEVVIGREKVERCWSLNLGAVYLSERFLNHDPPTEAEVKALASTVVATLAEQVDLPVEKRSTLAGVGGTLVNLAAVKLRLMAYSASRIHGTTLSQHEITAQIRRFCGVGLAERMTIPGLEPKRADVIIAGAVILLGIMTYAGVEQVYVSVRGARYGAMYDLAMSYER